MQEDEPEMAAFQNEVINLFAALQMSLILKRFL